MLKIDNRRKFFYLFFKQNPEVILALILKALGLFFKAIGCSFSIVFSLFSVCVCGYKIFLDGFFSTLKLKFSEKTLITVASLASIFIGEVNEAFLLLLLFKLGETLESIAKSKSRVNINKISEIMPDTANLLVEGEEKSVLATSLKIGDVFCVHPFQKIPCDGVILEGESSITLSNINGECLPQTVFPGDEVFSGSLNNSGTLKVKVTKIAKESFAGKILNLIEKSLKNKANAESFISRFSHKYTAAVILLSVVLFFVSLILKLGDINIILRRSLIFLVASCPCSMVISIPLAFFHGIGKSAKSKVLFKGSKYIESLSKIDTIFLDKTGTITKNTLEIEKIYSFSKLKEKQILDLCANIEFYSGHPIANAIKERSKIRRSFVKDVEEIPGFGVKGTLGGHELVCGNFLLLKKYNANTKNIVPDLPLYLVIDGQVAGGIKFKDSLKNDAKVLVKDLSNININSIILSGDKTEFVEEVAKECNIKTFFGDLLPKDKLEILKKYKSKGSTVGFVGDGINDAPSLAFADCGISMGLGSTAAVESSGVILLNDNISLIPKAIKFSKKVMNTVKFNIYFAIVLKFFVLFLSLFFYLPMWIAVFSDVGVTLISVLNALKIRQY